MSLIGLDGKVLESPEAKQERLAEAHTRERLLLIEAFGALVGLPPQPGHKWKDQAQLEAYRRSLATAFIPALGVQVLEQRYKIKITTQEGA